MTSIAQVQDALVELEAPDLTLGRRRELTEQVRKYLEVREGNHALQELLERNNNGMDAVMQLADELKSWRPTMQRVLTAEAVKLEADNKANRENSRLVTWFTNVFNARFVVLLAVIVAGFLGLRVTLSPTGIGVEKLPQVEESSP